MNPAKLLDRIAKLLDRIEDAAINGDVKRALLLCQELGGDTDSAELRDWAKRELEGFPSGSQLPDYRRVPGQLLGDGAAPGQRPSAVPIPMEALPEPERTEYANGIPLLHPISEIEARAEQARMVIRPSITARMLQAVNSSNESLATYDDIYFGMSGLALGGVVTAVQSRMVGLVTKLRSSLPADKHLDPAAVQTAFSETISGPVVIVPGDYNVIGVSDSGDVQVSVGSDGRSSNKPMSGVWSWMKRILEAITVFGAAVSFVGGSSFNPF